MRVRHASDAESGSWSTRGRSGTGTLAAFASWWRARRSQGAAKVGSSRAGQYDLPSW